MYCICCNENNVFPIPASQKSKLLEEDLLWKKEERDNITLTINNEMVVNGIIHIIDASYGSKHDGSQLIIAICDECIAKKIDDGTILFFDDYTATSHKYIKENIDKSKKIYSRRKNLDNLTDENG
jgi:hypothetical protein